MPSKKKAGSKTAAAPTQPIEISEEEQWRLINESGILNQVPQGISPSTLYPPSEAQVAAQSPPESSFCDEIFNAALLVIPFSSMFLLMEILIHQQYAKEVTVKSLAERLGPAIPILAVFIFYTNRHKNAWPTQLLLFVLANIGGPRLIWLFNRASYVLIMMQAPPLATLWVYAIVQLTLGRAILNLVIVGVWMKWAGMKLSSIG
ncbi:hypothetical protein BDV98DRAFT_229973 [Pterulicium gracile]|uniref:DUF7719 domain-containing protein n=1 Tax=Pterulicium gracile TaxID=1884261 RepID=A0A5C3R486_9AGAR|nr:hypothetical protein BDV98DRAFT_229973 [Pterula gracilis]